MHVQALGEPRVAAIMALGQVSEIVALYALSPLLARIRLKWILAAGIGFGVIRYALFALNNLPAVVAGIALHGLCFTLFFISAQIYLDQRIDRAFHARAQALLTLMVSGVGTLVGYLGCGWWREACASPAGTNWPLFWSVLCGLMIASLAYFLWNYEGRAAETAETGSPIKS
jgi:hypothetical protein